MKLTKAQRLFVAIGHIDKDIAWVKASLGNKLPFAEYDRTKSFPLHKSKIKRLKARRKQLIREALEAWRDTELDNFIKGYNACKNDEIL